MRTVKKAEIWPGEPRERRNLAKPLPPVNKGSQQRGFEPRIGTATGARTAPPWIAAQIDCIQAGTARPAPARPESNLMTTSSDPLPPPAGRSLALRGILWMLVAGVCFACMHATIKQVAHTGLHPFEIAFFRLLFGVLPTIPWFVRDGLAPLRTKRFGLMSLRGVLNVGAMMCFFTALAIAPLAQVTALGFTAPIFATILAVPFLGETVRLRRWTAIAIGFVGTVVILRPGFAEIQLGALLVLFSSVVWGGCMIIIKRLSTTESSATITVYMSVVMTPLMLIPAAFVWQWPTLHQFAWLVAVGCFGGGAQMAMAQALKLADTHVVGPVDFVRLIWVTLLGYLVFGEVPDAFVWIGGAMILASTAYIAYREHLLNRVKATVGPPGPR